MESENTSVEDLFCKSREYINTRIDLFKLKSINKASSIFSMAVAVILLIGILMLVVLFLSIGLAMYLGKILGAFHYGFFIVAGIYFVVGLFLFSFRKVLLKTPFSNWLIRNLMD